MYNVHKEGRKPTRQVVSAGGGCSFGERRFSRGYRGNYTAKGKKSRENMLEISNDENLRVGKTITWGYRITQKGEVGFLQNGGCTRRSQEKENL